LETTREADVAVVFGLQAQATGWNIPNDAVATHVARAPERLLFLRRWTRTAQLHGRTRTLPP
jgi:hypothetical protein